MTATFQNAWPYATDALNLPVKSVEEALPFYETVMCSLSSRLMAFVTASVNKSDEN